MFTGQHLDDHSLYHNRDSVLQQQQKGDLGDEQSDLSEEVPREERKELGDKTPEEEYEVRDGIANEKDLEAPLEKRQSTKSAKDPNLVGYELPLVLING